VKKTYDVEIPYDTIKELLIAHLYATSFLNDDQEVKDLTMVKGIDKFNKIHFRIAIQE
jgi:hypothetical protein